MLNKIKTLTPFLYFAVLGLFVSGVSFLVWVSSHQPEEKIIFGEIVDVTDGTIILEGRRDEKIALTFDAETKIFKGKDEVTNSPLVPGQFVQVFLADETNVATSIRLMKKPPEIKEHD